jgi:type I restriction enzyme M protein
MANNGSAIEQRLWDAADELRANSKLKASEYSIPVLGLIFLRYADVKFAHVEKDLAGKTKSGRRSIGKADYQARGVMYLPETARYSYLLNLPEGTDTGRAINEAMKAIETENEELRDVLPRNYNRLENETLVTLLKSFASIPMDVDGDLFGKIYEYFLGEFARAEGSKGGEFYTPTSIVRLIVEVIEPFSGRILDPACGSGGMFVQSARFVQEHKKNPTAEISIYGQEKVAETVRLCKMNLAVHGLAGDIREGNTYYEDHHKSIRKFDFVMANPPFNVDKVDKERLKDDKRFPFGIPKADNANYLWIQAFYSALSSGGRAGFVMANSASDMRGSELAIRRSLVDNGVVDVMISIASNFFYTVTLPCTLWFLDKSKSGSKRHNQVLFLDARHVHRQLDRAHRDFTDEQLEYLANLIRLYRGEPPEFVHGSESLLRGDFPELRYRDVAGLCRVSTISAIAGEGYSLNPSRYVGLAPSLVDDEELMQRLEQLTSEFDELTEKTHELEDRVSKGLSELLEGS